MPHVNILMLLVSSSKYPEALNAILEHFEARNAYLQFFRGHGCQIHDCFDAPNAIFEHSEASSPSLRWCELMPFCQNAII
jgi:hypothetical protein